MSRVVILIVLLINNAYAQDSLSALMQRMHSDSAVKMSYQQTRTMELFDQVWHGNGYMYSTPAGIMLREQLKPNRLLMAVNKDSLFYYDVEKQIRHQGTMQEGDPLLLQFAVFQALINADEVLLKHLYQIDFVTKPERWLMTLTPKQTDVGISIVVSGHLLQKLDTIIIKQADGDLSEFMLQTEEKVSSENISIIVNQLYAELVGK